MRGVLYLTAILSLLPLSAFGQAAVADLPAAPDAGRQQAPASSSTQAAPAKTPETTQEERQRGEQELKKEERQRILGVVPAFNTTNDRNAAPLSTRQKFELDMHSSLDPFAFALSALDAGAEQAEDTYPEYGQGTEGYAKRFGAAYADTFDGYLWGNAIFPSLLHEDPRYYTKGSGSVPRRALWAAWSTLWWRRDNGTWGPAYANVAGNFVAGGISNLYYPASDRGFSLTVTRALTVMAEGAIGSELVEFWPDVSRRFVGKKKHPATP